MLASGSLSQRQADPQDLATGLGHGLQVAGDAAVGFGELARAEAASS